MDNNWLAWRRGCSKAKKVYFSLNIWWNLNILRVLFREIDPYLPGLAVISIF
jgi:hypothetical protein